MSFINTFGMTLRWCVVRGGDTATFFTLGPEERSWKMNRRSLPWIAGLLLTLTAFAAHAQEPLEPADDDALRALIEEARHE